MHRRGTRRAADSGTKREMKVGLDADLRTCWTATDILTMNEDGDKTNLVGLCNLNGPAFEMI